MNYTACLEKSTSAVSVCGRDFPNFNNLSGQSRQLRLDALDVPSQALTEAKRLRKALKQLEYKLDDVGFVDFEAFVF